MDNLDWINFKKLARITEFVFGVIEQLDETPAGQNPYQEDPASFECRMIKRVVGRPLELILGKIGIPLPTNRAELDRFVDYVSGVAV